MLKASFFELLQINQTRTRKHPKHTTLQARGASKKFRSENLSLMMAFTHSLLMVSCPAKHRLKNTQPKPKHQWSKLAYKYTVPGSLRPKYGLLWRGLCRTQLRCFSGQRDVARLPVANDETNFIRMGEKASVACSQCLSTCTSQAHK